MFFILIHDARSLILVCDVLTVITYGYYAEFKSDEGLEGQELPLFVVNPP